MTQITATIDAWINPAYQSLDELLKRNDEGALSAMCFYHRDMPGFAKVGTATITFTSIDDDEIRAGMIAGMKDEISRIRAESTLKINAIEERLQQLLALPNLADKDAT